MLRSASGLLLLLLLLLPRGEISDESFACAISLVADHHSLCGS